MTGYIIAAESTSHKGNVKEIVPKCRSFQLGVFRNSTRHSGSLCKPMLLV
ncbi:hypothetical protein PT974_04330 [Cladobotryum mycophilum]|uniref:Uncharacterized protein n=1 Tax=Cladobotryum mycophilum TaxID=491253 RepID=A0ABR0SVV6_9HYPO